MSSEWNRPCKKYQTQQSEILAKQQMHKSLVSSTAEITVPSVRKMFRYHKFKVLFAQHTYAEQ